MPLVGVFYSSLNLSVEANPRQVQRGRELGDRAADIARFYHSIIGDVPYPAFTIALVESDLPGGHSPGYFAALNQPLPSSPLVWRNDPAAFSSFPEFFLAHELAHQWWGQAVGWRNYHEQWLSEGLRAVLRGALRAASSSGDDVVRVRAAPDAQDGAWTSRIRVPSISDTASDTSATKAACSARWCTTRARRCCTCCGAWSATSRSSAGCAGSTATSRFHKAGTEELRAAMEAEIGMSLERFFERWIYGSTLPKLKVGYRAEGTRCHAAGRADRRDVRRAADGRRCSTRIASRSKS